MDRDEALRQHLLYLLGGGGAHASFAEIIDGIPAELRGRKARGSPHTPWRLLEHMRIAQWDILEFSRDPAHVSPAWPDGYWPEGDGPPRPGDWDSSVERFRADLAEVERLVRGGDLFTPFSHGDGQTLLREALLVADHNAYHLGQLATVRRIIEQE